MQVKVKREKLSKAVQTTQRVISSKSPLPILSNILIQTHKNSLRLVATDLDMGISKSIQAEIEQEGAITLPARRISSIVKELPEEEVEIIVKKNNTTVIKSGNCVLKLIGIDDEEFPTLPKIEEGTQFTISAPLFKKMLNMTSFAISTDETRYVLNGLLFLVKNKALTLVGTDGRRLALKKENIDISKSCNIDAIIPYKAIYQLEKMLETEGEVNVNIGENQVLFKIEDTLIISRLIEGDFPDYKQVIPEESENKFYVNRSEFLNSLRRASILTTSESLGIKLDISKNNMIISKNTPEIGEIKEKLMGKYDGKELKIGFNPDYLIEVLKNYPEENIGFEITQTDNPGVIRSNENYLYLVLPMQLG